MHPAASPINTQFLPATLLTAPPIGNTALATACGSENSHPSACPTHDCL